MVRYTSLTHPTYLKIDYSRTVGAIHELPLVSYAGHACVASDFSRSGKLFAISSNSSTLLISLI